MIDKPRFRSAWLGTWPLGVVDFVLHALAAWLLPGPWWWQWLPDMVMPVLWLHGMATNRMVDDDNWLLQVHRMLHVRPPAVLLGVILWVGTAGYVAASGALLANIAAHIIIDRLTHDERWQ